MTADPYAVGLASFLGLCLWFFLTMCCSRPFRRNVYTFGARFTTAFPWNRSTGSGVDQPTEEFPRSAVQEQVQAEAPSPGLIALARAYQAGQLDQKMCFHCGGYHLRSCPRVKSLHGTLPHEATAVSYWRDGRWDTSAILWPEDLAAIEVPREEP